MMSLICSIILLCCALLYAKQGNDILYIGSFIMCVMYQILHTIESKK